MGNKPGQLISDFHSQKNPHKPDTIENWTELKLPLKYSFVLRGPISKLKLSHLHKNIQFKKTKIKNNNCLLFNQISSLYK